MGDQRRDPQLVTENAPDDAPPSGEEPPFDPPPHASTTSARLAASASSFARMETILLAGAAIAISRARRARQR